MASRRVSRSDRSPLLAGLHVYDKRQDTRLLWQTVEILPVLRLNKKLPPWRRSRGKHVSQS